MEKIKSITSLVTCDPENGILSVVFYGDRDGKQ